MPDSPARLPAGRSGRNRPGYGDGLATSDPTAARQERRWESRRELIVRAAVDVFAELGLEGATLEAVGERVGLTKASLYYYVKSKEELLGHVVGHVVRAQERAVAELTHAGMTPEERLRVFCLGHLRSLFADPAGRVAAGVALSGHTDELVRSVFHDYMGGLDAILADGVAAGVFRPVRSRRHPQRRPVGAQRRHALVRAGRAPVARRRRPRDLRPGRRRGAGPGRSSG